MGSELIPPWTVQSYFDAEGADQEEVMKKASHVMLRKYKRAGLIGFPIWSPGDGPGQEHWTLLCLRRFHEKLTKVTYYDSSQSFRQDCLGRAVQLLQRIQKDFPDEFDLNQFKEHQVPEKTNCKSFKAIAQIVEFSSCILGKVSSATSPDMAGA